MSELVSSGRAHSGAKRPTLLELARLARCVHPFAPVPIVVLGTLLLAGCPPPPLSLDEPDARTNSPPGISSVRNETGVEFAIGDDNEVIAGETSPSTMTLTLLDADVDDTLFVRGFFDYDVPPANQHLSARAVCNVGPSTPRSETRNVTCGLRAFCTEDDIPTSPHLLQIVVSDRVPDDAGDLSPPYYQMEDETGLQAFRTYRVVCQGSPI
jgi:hypothetical protein